jgi:hypothetical protein
VDDQEAVGSVESDDLELTTAFLFPNPGQQVGSGLFVLGRLSRDARYDVAGTGSPDAMLSAGAGKPDRLHLMILTR